MPLRSPEGRRSVTGAPMPAARSSQSARIARERHRRPPRCRAARQAAKSRAEGSGERLEQARRGRRGRDGSEGAPPDRACPSGAVATLTPKPITTRSGAPMRWPRAAVPPALPPSRRRSFGHFSARRGAPTPATASTASCRARPATKPSCGASAGSQGSIEQQAGVEVARRRGPGSALPSPPRALLVGRRPRAGRDRPRRAARNGVVVGRLRRPEARRAGSRRPTVCGGQPHVRTATRAAAPAAPTSGAGTSQNSTTTARRRGRARPSAPSSSGA